MLKMVEVENAVDAARGAREALRELVALGYADDVARGMLVGAALGSENPREGIERMMTATRLADGT